MRHLQTAILVALSLLLAGTAIAAGARPPAALPAAVAAELTRAGIAPANVAVRVRALDGDAAPALAVNTARPLNPASVMKLFTTYAALERLGPSHRYVTEVRINGAVQGGRLDGNLTLVGGGDPKLMQEDLWALLRDVRNRGIQRIGGDVILDSSAFAVPPHEPGAFDNEPLRPYNAGPAALLVNLRAISLRLVPDETGVRVLADTPGSLTLDNRLRRVDGDCGDWRERFTVSVAARTVTLSGVFAAACGEKPLSLSVAGEVEQIDDLFRALWSELGGQFDGRVRAGVAAPTAQLLTQRSSPPLADLVRDINKYSNNLMARAVLLSLDAARPASLPGARAAVVQALGERGIETTGLIIDNGAGLSRVARASAEQIGRLLDTAWAGPTMPEFVSSLPLLGRDGTLKKRLRDGTAAGRAHLKTGYLADVRSLAGYVLDTNGRRWSLVMLINDPHAAAARPAMDALIELVVQGALSP